MFNTLASYLLGTSNEQPAGGVEERNVRLTSVISDDDWVLVDRDSEGNSEVDSSSSVDDLEERDDCGKLDNQDELPCFLTRTSSTSSLPCTTMEESWFVTPPPCFTSAGPIHVETSPLENLLIEHPSMSVYQHSQSSIIARRYNSAVVPSATSNDYLVDEDDLVIEIIEEVPIHTTDERHVEAYLAREVDVAPVRHRGEALEQQEKQWFKNKQAQKVHIHRACQSLKRKYLERSNKAREVNYRNRRQRRGERSQGATRSYANNNRKC